MKRPAAATSAGVASKRPALDQSVVADALLVAKFIPEAARRMQRLRESLGVPQEGRHDFQVRILEMSAAALRSSGAGLERDLVAAKEALRQAEVSAAQAVNSHENAQLALNASAA